MHVTSLLLASSSAAGVAARIAAFPNAAHQVTIADPLTQDGPGPFNADSGSSKAPSSAISDSSPGTTRSFFSLCDGPEGTIQTINGTPYRTYCYNSLWSTYVGLGYHKTIEACESAYTSSAVKPKIGYHWYPSTGACYLFNKPGDLLYVYHYGNYEKVFFAPLDTPTPPDGPICPLPEEGGWSKVAGQWHRLYCRGMAKAEPRDIKQYGKTTTDIGECAKWAKSVGAKMWHWWQPYQDAAPGLATGQRNCEGIMTMPDRLVPLRTKDTYIAGVPSSPSDADVVDMFAKTDL